MEPAPAAPEPTSAAVSAPDPASAAVTARLRPPERGVDRRAVTLWTLRALVRWGLLLAALVTAALLWGSARVWLVAPIAVVGVVLLVTALVEPRWRFRVHRWEISEHATYATTGWIVQEWRVAPTSRIQTVDAVRGPLEQLLGLSTLRVTTASSAGAVMIAGLSQQEAEDAAARLAVVAELSEGDAT